MGVLASLRLGEKAALKHRTTPKRLTPRGERHKGKPRLRHAGLSGAAGRQPPEDKPHRRRGRGVMRGEDDFRGIRATGGGAETGGNAARKHRATADRADARTGRGS